MNDSSDAMSSGARCSACGRPLPSPATSCTSCYETLDGTPLERPEFTGPRRVGPYRIVREVGHGGMGTVFEAHDDGMNRRVALKVLSRHHAPSEKTGRRFEQEAWIAGKLDHPNLVTVYERGVWEELSYYSMELLEGGSLQGVIENMKRWGRDDRLELEYGSREYVHWAITTIIGAARGLAYAHRHGVVHRDIKPMNLVLTDELDCVKVTDFGLAIDADTTRMTTAGKLLGTLAYMAPEQILGRSREIDERTDVYALGVTLFEMLTLEFPYQAETQQLYMNAVLTAEARRPSRLNERVGHDLEVVISKALAKAQKDRYPSADAFADDLENVLNFRPIRASAPGTASRIWNWIRRRPLHAALIAILLVGTPVVGILTWRSVQHARLQRQIRIEALWADARMLVSLNEEPDQKRIVEQILREDPDHVDALRTLAVIDFHEAIVAGDETERAQATQRMRVAIERITKLEPTRSWPHSLEAHMLRQLGRPEAARAAEERSKAMRTAEPDTPDTDDVRYDALLAWHERDYARAVPLFSTVLLSRPDEITTLILRGRSLEELGRLDEANEDFRFAARLDPEAARPQIHLARVLAKRGKREEGQTIASRARQLEPEEAGIRESLSELWVEWGRAAVNRGDASEGRRLLERAASEARASLEIDPGRPWAHINLGLSLVEQYRLDDVSDPARLAEAIDHYESASSLAGDVPRPDRVRLVALRNTCDATLESGDYARAFERCGEALDLDPNDAMNHYNMAGLYALTGRTEEAFNALTRNVELGDRDWAYLQRDPWFAAMREDPRFSELIRRMRATP